MIQPRLYQIRPDSFQKPDKTQKSNWTRNTTPHSENIHPPSCPADTLTENAFRQQGDDIAFKARPVDILDELAERILRTSDVQPGDDVGDAEGSVHPHSRTVQLLPMQ